MPGLGDLSFGSYERAECKHLSTTTFESRVSNCENQGRGDNMEFSKSKATEANQRIINS